MKENIIARGRVFIREGRFEKAQIILRRALNQYPNSALAVELSGDLAAKLHSDNEATQHYERASEIYENNHQYAEAIICLEKILALNKTKNELIFRLFNLYKSYGLPNDAIKKILEFCNTALENKEETVYISGLKEIVNLQSKNPALRLSYAKILYALNRSAEAEDELHKLKTLAEETNNEKILNEINKVLPQYDGGDEELDPKSRVELGKLLYEIGSKDEAIIEFNKAVNDLLKRGDKDDAIKILNHMIEIDPNNSEALNELEELTRGAVKPEEKPTPIPVEEMKPVPETTPEAALVEELKLEVPPEPKIEETTPKSIDQGAEFLQDLSREVAGFVAATRAEVPNQEQPEELPSLEGQIADIEFLLKEAEEAPSMPIFEIAQSFGDFKNNIIWENEDLKKKLTLAKMAYDAELYDTTLNYLKFIKDNRESWPWSLELTGGAQIKLGHYDEAIQTVAPATFLKEIPAIGKIELNYLLATAYEGLGDFENAIRRIEYIIGINPNYKDVKELYELMGGKELTEEIETTVEAPPIVEEEAPHIEVKQTEFVEVSPKIESEGYPIIEEPIPEEKTEEKILEEMPEVEERGEKIAFL